MVKAGRTQTTAAEREAGGSSETAAFVSGLESKRARWRSRLFRLTMLALSIAIALVIGELAVRVFAPQVIFPRYITDGGFGIRVNVPNARYWHTSPEIKVQFRINSMGVRSDREYPFEKPQGIIRIVGLGDSFTQGYEVDLHETYLYRLEQMLKAQGLPVEVINLGVSGHGNAEELLMLREFALRFRPDVVVVGYYSNDLRDNVRSNLFRLDDQKNLIRASDSYLPAVGIRDRLYSLWAFRTLAENSQLFSLARERLSLLVKRKLVEKHTETAPGETVDDHSPQLAARLLDEIRRECAAHEAKFLVLDIPGHRLESHLPEAYFSGITSEEIVRPLSALRAEGSDAYLYRQRGHRHWTPRSHEIAAGLLAERLTPWLRTLVQRPETPSFEPGT